MVWNSARKLCLALTASASMSACASMPQTQTAAKAESRVTTNMNPDTLTDAAHALHLLNRLTFGPRPGDVDNVMKLGADRWIEQQLGADTALDVSATMALAGCPLWTEPVATAEGRLSGMERFVMDMRMGERSNVVNFAVSGVGFLGVITRDSAANILGYGAIFAANSQLIACKYARAEFSEHQLLEVMTDFWHNHFYFSGSNIPTRGSIIAFDRATIRPRSLGHFRDLLGAVAHSPTMLQYLDNSVSQADTTRRTLRELLAMRDSSLLPASGRTGLNENYARELLELHTLGVDGGYTQLDVVEVARALTGWTHSRAPRAATGSPAANLTAAIATGFIFDTATHDAEPKTVLGHALAGGRGIEDGEDVLDILARHPSTARFIARKLAVRFVSDKPAESLIERAAQVFLDSDGDIRKVVRAIVTSAEFQSPDIIGAKVKSPLEFVLSLRRVFGAPVDTAGEEIDLLVNLKQAPFGNLTPDGWPETGARWLTVSTMKTRFEIIHAVAYGELPSIPVEEWSGWKVLVSAPFEVQVKGVIDGLLNGQASANTRAVMESARSDAGAPGSKTPREDSLRELIVLALSSPEFMRR